MTELSPLDAGFMEIENADRHISLGIGAVAIIEGPAPTRESFRAGLDRGLEVHGRLRQRVHRSRFDLATPLWEDDPNFDLAHHVRWTSLPKPGDEQALRELVATELAEQFDRDHPLWDVVVVENLGGGRWAMIVRAHHSVVDGISGLALFESFCDPGADGQGARHEMRSRAGMFGTAAGALRLLWTVPRIAADAVRVLTPVIYAAVAPASDSSLNGPIGRQRRYAVARTSLPQAREIAAAFEVTVNDVAVAAIAAAYRRLLQARGEKPTPDKLRMMVPVSMRADDAKYVPDNRVSAIIVQLPIEFEHPVERLNAVHERIARHRLRGEAEAEKSLLELAEWLPYGVVAWVFRTASRFPQRGVGVLATNIPGPPHRLTLGGRKVLEIWPCIPIAMRVRTTVAVLSYTDQLTFGITGDYDTNPDIDEIASGIATEVAVLLAHARGRPA
ncbi:wax ester/triacylglycerol synthase family O-acyltransferase [Nocardia aurantiaca]|uniref:Diacylglycerol O-acyltransferase n=1 Tax=Nocardia aurantiaca TaxID=2675850 RepID=A0A6I3L3Z7_9NOCA|nr:wax ester/triacylglycerol synthase family O-acyltransferase [Nocardia aurantiaca]MTE15216.1 wax ester/triacylglycerol synthase family O-acyltransferase [Nocardia aurantiaca]